MKTFDGPSGRAADYTCILFLPDSLIINLEDTTTHLSQCISVFAYTYTILSTPACFDMPGASLVVYDVWVT